MTTPPFPTAMFKTAKPVWIVTVSQNIKSNPIPATASWTAAPWAPIPAPQPACRVPPPSMTTANPALTKAPSPAAPAPILALMRNVQADTINPAASPATTGTEVLRPAHLLVPVIIAIPVPAPVTPADMEAHATENTPVVIVPAITHGPAAAAKLTADMAICGTDRPASVTRVTIHTAVREVMNRPAENHVTANMKNVLAQADTVGLTGHATFARTNNYPKAGHMTRLIALTVLLILNPDRPKNVIRHGISAALVCWINIK